MNYQDYSSFIFSITKIFKLHIFFVIISGYLYTYFCLFNNKIIQIKFHISTVNVTILFKYLSKYLVFIFNYKTIQNIYRLKMKHYKHQYGQTYKDRISHSTGISDTGNLFYIYCL